MDWGFIVTHYKKKMCHGNELKSILLLRNICWIRVLNSWYTLLQSLSQNVTTGVSSVAVPTTAVSNTVSAANSVQSPPSPALSVTTSPTSAAMTTRASTSQARRKLVLENASNAFVIVSRPSLQYSVDNLVLYRDL